MKRTIGIQAEMNVDACVGVMCDMKAHNVGSQINSSYNFQLVVFVLYESIEKSLKSYIRTGSTPVAGCPRGTWPQECATSILAIKSLGATRSLCGTRRTGEYTDEKIKN